jgi:hypothetical protein
MRSRAIHRISIGVSLVLGAFGAGRAEAQAPGTAPRPNAEAQGPAGGGEEVKSAEAVNRLVAQLTRHPAQPSKGADRLGLYLMDVTKAEVTLIADEPDPGLSQCGSPAWSNDGKIFFDATPGTQWNLTRLKVIDLVDGRLKVTDLGPGNCPSPSPSGDRVVFLLNPGALPDAEAGVWIMEGDGSERRKLGGYGRPLWSPGGHQFLIVSFSSPREVTVIDDRPGRKSGVLKIPENNIYTMPSWAGEGTIVAVIGADAPDTIALLDVSDPQDGKIKKVLWRKADDQDLKLNYPVYSPKTRRCMFVGGGDKGMDLYTIEPDKPGPPTKLGPVGQDKHISGLVYSPDGRYLLFSSDRPGRL